MEKTKRRRTSRLTERNPRLLKASSAVAFSLCPGLSFRLFGFSRNSRRKPTPNTAPTAMCVELTGSPSAVAISTVTAAAKATQYARGEFKRVILAPTTPISLGPKSPRPRALLYAPPALHHSGIANSSPRWVERPLGEEVVRTIGARWWRDT